MMKRMLALALSAILLIAAFPAAAEGKGTATFYLNGEEAAEVYLTAEFTLGEWIDKPKAPVREGFVFDNWYADAEGTEKFNFNARYEADTSIYAAWKRAYVFEAEYTDLTGRPGQGYSGNTSGIGLIGRDNCNAGASNGYYVSCLYYNGAYLTFEIECDRDTDDVTIVLSLSSEFDDIILSGDEYFVDVNGEIFNVEADLTGAIPVTKDGEHQKRPFTLHTVASKVHLNEGTNIIELVTNNDVHMSGATMEAKAPMVDCMYLYTAAGLSWNPVTENIE